MVYSAGMEISVGRRIASARHEAGYRTAKAFAEAVGVSDTTVRKWEADDAHPRKRHFERIVELTGKSIAYFYGEDSTDANFAELLSHLQQHGLHPLGNTTTLPVVTRIPQPSPHHATTTGERLTVPVDALPTDADRDALCIWIAERDIDRIRRGDLIVAIIGERGTVGDLVLADDGEATHMWRMAGHGNEPYALTHGDELVPIGDMTVVARLCVARPLWGVA